MVSRVGQSSSRKWGCKQWWLLKKQSILKSILCLHLCPCAVGNHSKSTVSMSKSTLQCREWKSVGWTSKQCVAVEGVTEHKGMLLNTAAGMATYMVVARQSELSNHESKLLSHSRCLCWKDGECGGAWPRPKAHLWPFKRVTMWVPARVPPARASPSVSGGVSPHSLNPAVKILLTMDK